MKKALVFPGQGSQFPGMAKDLYETSAKAKDLLETANQILGFRITDIMFDGTPEDLKVTRVTQPAVFLHSVVHALCSADFEGEIVVAGHSLGEYSALAVAGALSFEDALRLVSARAALMQQCCEKVPGGMAAVLGLPDETVEEVCASVRSRQGGVVVAANYNCPGQVVISGDNDAVAAACGLMKEAGAKRALPLAVSGAFHSPLMAPAAQALAEAISATEFHAAKYPVYQNVTASAETDPEVIKDNLLKQLTSPVLWTQSVRAMRAAGVEAFEEYGPGSVLTGLISRI